MTIHIAPELEARLHEAARERGLDASQYAAQLIEQALPERRGAGAVLELFAKWAREEATHDPAEIERRNREFEEFSEAMNRNRLETEGPGAAEEWSRI